MALLRGIAGFIVTIAVIFFALLNREIVSVTWSPFQPPQNLPLYIPLIVFMAGGFCLGALCVWFNSGETRRQRRNYKNQVGALQKLLKEKTTSTQPSLPAPLKKD